MEDLGGQQNPDPRSRWCPARKSRHSQKPAAQPLGQQNQSRSGNKLPCKVLSLQDKAEQYGCTALENSSFHTRHTTPIGERQLPGPLRVSTRSRRSLEVGVGRESVQACRSSSIKHQASTINHQPSTINHVFLSTFRDMSRASYEGHHGRVSGLGINSRQLRAIKATMRSHISTYYVHNMHANRLGASPSMSNPPAGHRDRALERKSRRSQGCLASVEPFKFS